jgi:phosphopantothenoylcysteine decarboxylase/phosphopantothenate--cysteine ligase
VEKVAVLSAQEMHDGALAACADASVFIGVAAVADYRPEHVETQKIKKSRDRMHIDLVRNPDILADVAALPDRPFTVGFAAETEKVEQHAREKLLKKGVDLIAANDVSGDTGFGGDDNHILLVDRSGARDLGRASKTELARRLIELIGERLNASGPDQDTRRAHR